MEHDDIFAIFEVDGPVSVEMYVSNDPAYMHELFLDSAPGVQVSTHRESTRAPDAQGDSPPDAADTVREGEGSDHDEAAMDMPEQEEEGSGGGAPRDFIDLAVECDLGISSTAPATGAAIRGRPANKRNLFCPADRPCSACKAWLESQPPPAGERVRLCKRRPLAGEDLKYYNPGPKMRGALSIVAPSGIHKRRLRHPNYAVATMTMKYALENNSMLRIRLHVGDETKLHFVINQ